MFELEFNKNYNCFEIMISNAAKFLERDHRMMFLGAWGFDFKDSISVNYENTRGLLEKFHGIKLKHIEINNLKTVKNIINEELVQNKIVAIKCDSYNCKWNLAYKKYHIPHFYLIFDFYKGIYSVIDLYSTEKIINISDLGSFEKIYFFELKDVDDNKNKSEVINLLGQNSFLNQKTEQSKKIITFSNELNNFNIQDIKKPDEIWANIFYIQLKEIINGRKNYMLALKYIQEKILNIDIIDILEINNDIVSKWEKIYRLFLKISFGGDSDIIIKRIQNLLNNVADKETMFANKINTTVKQSIHTL